MCITTGADVTEEHLQHIDLCLASAAAWTAKQPMGAVVATYCALASVEHDFLNEELRILGFDSYAALQDFQWRRPYERSLWVRRSSDNRCVPVLYALAVLRYGTFAPALKPFWSDGDQYNDASSNVSLMPLAGSADSGSVRNKYGVRSTSPEYRKRYYADPVNKQRNAAHQRATQARKRVALDKATAVVAASPDLADKITDLKKKLGVD